MSAVAPIQKSKANPGKRAGGHGGKPIRVRLAIHADPPELSVRSSYVLTGSIPLIVAGREIVCRGDEKVWLDDIWRAAGSPAEMRPRYWVKKHAHRYISEILQKDGREDYWSAFQDGVPGHVSFVLADLRLGLIYAAMVAAPGSISIAQSHCDRVAKRTYGDVSFEGRSGRSQSEQVGGIEAGDWRVRYARQESVSMPWTIAPPE